MNSFSSGATVQEYRLSPNVSNPEAVTGDYVKGTGCQNDRSFPGFRTDSNAQVNLYTGGGSGGFGMSPASALDIDPGLSFAYGPAGANLIPLAGRWQAANRCPWGGTPDAASGECAYTYEHTKATQYALKYARATNPVFCKYDYPGPATTCGGEKATDCANFVSQAMLYGGVPMTNNEDNNYAAKRWLCVRNGNGVCEHPPQAENWSGAYCYPVARVCEKYTSRLAIYNIRSSL